MLNYLEKYCQPGDVVPNSNNNHQMASELSQPSSIRVDATTSAGAGAGVIEPPATTTTPQQTNEPATSGTNKIGQATKAKRNHCSLM